MSRVFVFAKKYYFSVTIFSLLVLAVASSYYRFIILNDYIVAYEGECDPYTSTCFVYCEDESCNEPFYYSIIERNASELSVMCGADVTSCDAAYECIDEDTCTISYCDPDDESNFCDDIQNNSSP